MGVTGRRSSGPGPAGVSGDAEAPHAHHAPHAHLTLAITPAPTANHYQHVQGGFVRSEPAGSLPHSEDDLQSGLRRRKRADQPSAEEVAGPAEDAVDDPAEGPAEAASDDGDMFLEPDAAAPSPTGEPSADTTGQPQNLFPAFQPLFPLGHSRPTIFQEPAFSQRQALLRPQYNGFLEHPVAHPVAHHREPRLELPGVSAFRERAYPQVASAPSAPAAELHSNALLGSGNFGVIHGGTFYGEEKEQDYDAPASPLHSFYGGNGHGRPAFYRGNPEPQRYRTAEDFFANFRDFADISTPTKSSFSEYYVVYVNRNASRAEPGTVVGPLGTAPTTRPAAHAAPVARPNNIMERLAQIDREQHGLEHGQEHGLEGQEEPKKKLSLAKRKLALLKKKSSSKKAAAARDAAREAPQGSEPLLALS